VESQNPTRQQTKPGCHESNRKSNTVTSDPERHKSYREKKNETPIKTGEKISFKMQGKPLEHKYLKDPTIVVDKNLVIKIPNSDKIATVKLDSLQQAILMGAAYRTEQPETNKAGPIVIQAILPERHKRLRSVPARKRRSERKRERRASKLAEKVRQEKRTAIASASNYSKSLELAKTATKVAQETKESVNKSSQNLSSEQRLHIRHNWAQERDDQRKHQGRSARFAQINHSYREMISYNQTRGRSNVEKLPSDQIKEHNYKLYKNYKPKKK
jgi:hypothetical protein